MVLPIRLALLTLALSLGVPATVEAETPAQRQELVAALRQLDALERRVAHSAAQATATPGERYHFDYPRLLADLTRVRAGLRDYLAPARAQPRDLADLAGHYRAEAGAMAPPPPEARP